MPNNYGYGPTRNLNPNRLRDLNNDNNTTGNLSSLVVALGEAVLAKDPTLHAALVGRDADIFDGLGTFLTGANDLNDNYAVGGASGATDDEIVAELGTRWSAGGGGSPSEQAIRTRMLAIDANSFTTHAAFITTIVEIITAYSDIMSSWSTFFAAFPSTTAGGGTAITPHVYTADPSTDATQFAAWALEAVIPGRGGIQMTVE